MAFVPGLSKKQVQKVITDYANIAPATMQLITNLSSQINNPNDPAAALIGQMATIQNNFNSLYAEVQGLASGGAAVADNSITTNKIVNGAVTNDKLQNSAITINGSSVNLGGSVNISTGGGGGDSLPSQLGNSGKYLKTDGITASWATVPAGSSSISSTNPEFIVYETTLKKSFYLMGMGGESVSINKMGGALSGTVRVPAWTFGVAEFVAEAQAGMYSKRFAVPTYWLTKEQPDFMNIKYSYVNYSSVWPIQEWNGMEWVASAYEINFNDYNTTLYSTMDSYFVGDFAMTSGQVRLYEFLGQKEINSELAYLDGATANIQTQINSLKNAPLITDPTIKVYGDAQSLGSTQFNWSGHLYFSTNSAVQSFAQLGTLQENIDFFALVSNTFAAGTAECYIRTYSPYWATMERKVTGIDSVNNKILVESGSVGYEWQNPYGTLELITKTVTNISKTELATLDGMTSSIQGQLDAMADVVDAVPATVTSTLNSALGTMFVNPTIKRPTIETESASGIVPVGDFAKQGNGNVYELWYSNHPAYIPEYFTGSSEMTVLGTYHNLLAAEYSEKEIEIQLNGVTGPNANLLNTIIKVKLSGYLGDGGSSYPYSWIGMRTIGIAYNSQTDFSNATITWGNIRTITSTELKTLDGISGNIQNQINSIKTNGVFDYPTIKFGEGFRLVRSAIPESYISPNSYFDGTNNLFRIYVQLETSNPAAAELMQQLLALAKSSGNVENYMGMDQAYTSADIVISGVTGGDPNINGTHNAVIKNLYGNPLTYEITFTGAEWQLDANYNPLSDISNMLITCGNTIKITQTELEALDGVTGNIQAQLDYIMSLINP